MKTPSQVFGFDLHTLGLSGFPLAVVHLMVGTGEPVTAHLNSTNCCSCTSWNRGLIVAWGGCVTEPASDSKS